MPLNYPPLGYTGEDLTLSQTSQSKEGIVRAATATEAVGTRTDIFMSPSTTATAFAAAFATATTNYGVATVTLTSAQIKALRATPITVIAAPGTGKTIAIESIQCKLAFGTNVFTNPQNLALRYTNGSGVVVSSSITASGFVDAAASTYTSGLRVANAIVAATGAENQAIVIHNTGASEITGNAANDNTIVVNVSYRVLTQ